MITYSVTINVKKEIEDSWLKWMKEVHIKDVIKTGFFNGWQIKKLILPEPGNEESAFIINYITDSIDKYYKYIEEEAPRLQKEHTQKFDGKFKASRAVYLSISK